MSRLAGCHCCGLVQQLPALAAGDEPICARCSTPLSHGNARRNQWTAALSAAALLLYPAAMLLPIIGIERLGHRQEDSLLAGVWAMWAEGYWVIGGVVLLFSILLPPLKLLGLLLLSSPRLLGVARHRALLYRAVELLGRWGMLDVMLVALLVAFVKLGDLVTIQAGAGALAFTVMVLMSLCASLCFDPHAWWQDNE